jgi:LysM repeat protein
MRLAPLLVLACLAALPLRAWADGDAAGTAAASFLSVGSGVSVQSMAGATLASGEDLAAAAWNPASLARVDALQFSLAHAPLPGGASQDWAAGGGRMLGEWRWGLQALFHREADIEGRDAANNPTGTLSASDLAFEAGLARRVAGRFDLGLGAEWLHESLAGAPGSGLGFSGGVRGEFGPFGLALAARHLGGAMRYDGARYDLPAVVAAGASYEDPTRGLRFAADLESPAHYYRALRVGGEWMWRGQVALRAGYRAELGGSAEERLSGPTFGLGTGVSSMWLDYAFSPQGGEGSGEHRVGLTFRPGLASHAATGSGLGMVTAPPREPPAPRRVRPAPTPKPRKASASRPERATPVRPPSPPPAAASSPPAFVSAPAETASPERVSAPPAKAPDPAPPAPKPAPVASERPKRVVVAEGETLADIARRWHTSVPALMMLNNLVRERVEPGQRLKLPPAPKR